MTMVISISCMPIPCEWLTVNVSQYAVPRHRTTALSVSYLLIPYMRLTVNISQQHAVPRYNSRTGSFRSLLISSTCWTTNLLQHVLRWYMTVKSSISCIRFSSLRRWRIFLNVHHLMYDCDDFHQRHCGLIYLVDGDCSSTWSTTIFYWGYPPSASWRIYMDDSECSSTFSTSINDWQNARSAVKRYNLQGT